MYLRQQAKEIYLKKLGYGEDLFDAEDHDKMESFIDGYVIASELFAHLRQQLDAKMYSVDQMESSEGCETMCQISVNGILKEAISLIDQLNKK